MEPAALIRSEQGHSVGALGLFVGTMVGGGWLWILTLVARANDGPYGAVIGWGFLIAAGVAVALLAPLVVMASAHEHGLEWVSLTLGSTLGGALGLAAAFVSGVYSSESPMVALLSVSSVAALLALVLAVRTMRDGLAPILLVIGSGLACLALVLPWRAVLTGTVQDTSWFALGALASPFGIGAGLGAWAACALFRWGGRVLARRAGTT
jgi:hypothetical protein